MKTVDCVPNPLIELHAISEIGQAHHHMGRSQVVAHSNSRRSPNAPHGCWGFSVHTPEEKSVCDPTNSVRN